MSNAVYYMERDGAVKIPEKYDKMNHEQITEECARLTKEKIGTNKAEKKEKTPCKTKFAI